MDNRLAAPFSWSDCRMALFPAICGGRSRQAPVPGWFEFVLGRNLSMVFNSAVATGRFPHCVARVPTKYFQAVDHPRNASFRFSPRS